MSSELRCWSCGVATVVERHDQNQQRFKEERKPQQDLIVRYRRCPECKATYRSEEVIVRETTKVEEPWYMEGAFR